MKRQALVAGGLLVAGAAVAAAIMALKPEVQRKRPEKRTPLVRVLRVQAQERHLVITSQGTVRPRTEAVLVAEVPGRVLALADGLGAGSPFLANQPLVFIDELDLVAARSRAAATLAQAQVRLEAEKAETRLAKKEWKQLGEGEGTALSRRDLQLTEALASRDAALATFQQAQRNVERANVSAPFDGRVRQVLVDVGQYVAPGTPLVRVFDTDVVEVRLPVTVRDMRALGIPLDFFLANPAVKTSVKNADKPASNREGDTPPPSGDQEEKPGAGKSEPGGDEEKTNERESKRNEDEGNPAPTRGGPADASSPASPPATKDKSAKDAESPGPETPKRDSPPVKSPSTPAERPHGPKVTLTASGDPDGPRWIGEIVRTEGVIDERTRMVHLVARVERPYDVGAPAPSAPEPALRHVSPPYDAHDFPDPPSAPGRQPSPDGQGGPGDSAASPGNASSPRPEKERAGSGNDRRRPLVAGMFVNAAIEGRWLPGAVAIPRHALRGEDQVLVVDAKSRLRYRRVRVAHTEGRRAVISEGLSDGDRVCLSRVPAATDGMRVRVREDNGKADR